MRKKILKFGSRTKAPAWKNTWRGNYLPILIHKYPTNPKTKSNSLLSWHLKTCQLFWRGTGENLTVQYSKERKSNVKILIFVAICGKIQDHPGISTIKTE